METTGLNVLFYNNIRCCLNFLEYALLAVGSYVFSNSLVYQNHSGNQMLTQKTPDSITEFPIFHCLKRVQNTGPVAFLKWDSLHTVLNSHYIAWSYKKKKHKKIKAYSESLNKKPPVNKCLLILDLKPFTL